MPELESCIEFNEEAKSILRQAFGKIRASGAAAQAETEKFEKKWGLDVARDVLPEKPKSAQALIQVLQLIPGVSLDQEAKQTIERSIFGSSRATRARLYETHTPGRASEDNSWIEVGYSVRRLERLGEEKELSVVSFSRAVDLKDLTLELVFDKDDISLQGGRVRDLEHNKYPYRNLIHEKGVIQFDTGGNTVDTKGSLANFTGRIELPRLIASITTREKIDEPIDLEKIIPIKKSE